jgi:hypothetical protein
MSAQPAYRIEENEDDDKWIVEFSRGTLSREQVSSFLDYLTVASIRSRSQMTDDAIAAIAQDVDHALAERLRARLEEE